MPGVGLIGSGEVESDANGSDDDVSSCADPQDAKTRHRITVMEIAEYRFIACSFFVFLGWILVSALLLPDYYVPVYFGTQKSSIEGNDVIKVLVFQKCVVARK